jgi:hypothetical protein
MLIIVIIPMLTLCYSLISYATLILYHHTSVINYYGTLIPNNFLIFHYNKCNNKEVRGIQQNKTWGRARFWHVE